MIAVTCIFFSNGLQGWCRNWLYGDASNLEAFFSKLIEKLRIEGRLKLEEQKDTKKEKKLLKLSNCQTKNYVISSIIHNMQKQIMSKNIIYIKI